MELLCSTPLIFLLAASLFFGMPPPASAELRPTHVAVIANERSPDSLAVTRHYAARRGIPAGHIIMLDLPLSDTISREQYETHVVVPIREALATRGLATSIKVLVTTYGVPLRVAAPEPSLEESRWLADARTRVTTSRVALEQIRDQLGRLLPEGISPPPSPAVPAQELLEEANAAAFLSRIEQTWRAALDQERPRIDKEAGRSSPDFFRLTQAYGGWSLALQNRLDPAPPTSQSENSRRSAWLTLLKQTGPYWGQLGQTPIKTERSLIYRWVERLFGNRGVLELASSEVDRLTYSHADAALDSELSLLWWDRDLYPVAWRMGNPLYQSIPSSQEELPVLMVSRLDGPTGEIAKGLVDKALAAEQTGLQGTFYFDARGIPAKSETDAYGRYDQSLRDAAALAQARASFRVVLDTAEPTLTAALDVALYIGWYRLRSYDDVFSFRPGAIGYHMASAEALSLHDPAERGWCKNALERGITATLGSVNEPYLDAFPEPARFTELVISGRYALVEVYALTSRYVSWRMVLLGDPLYNPMKGRGIIPPRPLPMAPSDRRWGDPVAQAARMRDLAHDRQQRLVTLLRQAEDRLQPKGVK